ncbi:MAG TPA: response regulator [Clostridiales bacterium]|nr:response regulator [Clostridiales bacterium]
MRILIAEDERDLNRIIKEYLEDEGYSVDACFDGEQAQDCLLCANYDALVLDIQMPKKNGIELVRSLRTKGDLTPVLFLTARDTVEDKISGLDSGADYYLTKPFSFDELNAVIRAISRKYDHTSLIRLRAFLPARRVTMPAWKCSGEMTSFSSPTRSSSR